LLATVCIRDRSKEISVGDLGKINSLPLACLISDYFSESECRIMIETKGSLSIKSSMSSKVFLDFIYKIWLLLLSSLQVNTFAKTVFYVAVFELGFYTD
jgi:hypothetical protein